MDEDSGQAPAVLITGAGHGFGAALARRFARAGYRVAVTDRDSERARHVATSLQAGGSDAMPLTLDVTRQQDWQQALQRVERQWGGIDVLVNNAGVAAAGLCEETSLDDWQWVIDIDLMGVVRGCHTFLPLLRQRAAQGRQAYIINVASFAGLSAMPGVSAYGTAKAAVVALSEHLYTELMDSGIGVSVVCPSFVRTGLMESFRSADPSVRGVVEAWMDRSGVNADDIAEMIYQAMQRRQLLVLTHRKTRTAWWLKRLWPARYYRQVAKFARLARSTAA